MAYFYDPNSYANNLFGAPFARRRPSPPSATYYPREANDPYARALAEEQAARSALQDAVRREREARQRRAEEEAKAHIRDRMQIEAQARQRRPQTFFGYPSAFGYGFPESRYRDYEDDDEDGDDVGCPYPSYFTAVPRYEHMKKPQPQATAKFARPQSRSPLYKRQQSQSPVELSSSPKVSIPISTPSNPAHPEPSLEEKNVAAFKIQSAYHIHASLSSITSARERFAALLNSFTFPLQLDFDLAFPHEGEERPKLAYTSHNTQVHAHEDALIKLLQTLDAVESHGDMHVREARRELVRGIEKELGRVDAEVRRRWEEVRPKADAEVETVPTPTPVEGDVSEAPGEAMNVENESRLPSEPIIDERMDDVDAPVEAMQVEAEPHAPSETTIDEPTSPIDANMDELLPIPSSSPAPATKEAPMETSLDVPAEKVEVEEEEEEKEDVTTSEEPAIELVESPAESLVETPPHVSLPLPQPIIRMAEVDGAAVEVLSLSSELEQKVVPDRTSIVDVPEETIQPDAMFQEEVENDTVLVDAPRPPSPSSPLVSEKEFVVV